LQSFDVAVIGAGAADMMCAADACKRTGLAVERAMARAGGGYNFQWAWSSSRRAGRAA
jgi:predicted flavoprotein YhiN